MIPLIETGGSPREIGFDVGRGAREQIAAAMAAVEASYTPEQWSALNAALPPFFAAIDELVPDCAEELRGMAEGAGVAYETLVLANASEEVEQSIGLAQDADRIGAPASGGGCTVAGVTQFGTIDGHVLLGHNEDASAGWADFAYVVKAEPDGQPTFAAFTYAGYLLHQGVNSSGIGSVGNALYARDVRIGIPKLFLYRRAIAAATIEGAIRAATDPKRAFGNNHLFADADGNVIDIELSGGHWSMLHAGNRFLAHANHFVSPELHHLDAEEDLLNSRLRQLRVERLLDARWGSLDLPAFQEILADHSNYPKSVCKHHAPESELDYGTIGSVVVDVTTRTLWACAGNPCRAEWCEVRL